MECNGHRERFKLVELVETMSLTTEVQSCREDNERVLRSQEKKKQLNDQVVQGLNMLKKKMKSKLGSMHEKESRPH